MREIIAVWHANVIRLPFNQDWCLRGRNGHSAEEYLASIDHVISWAAGLGAYTILDLQWLDADTAYGYTQDENQMKRPNYVAPTPNRDTLLLWRILAERYRDEPAVLFDILNEPHDPLADDFLPIHLVAADGEILDTGGRSVGPEEWVPWATLLTAEVRKIRVNGIILVAGVDWAFDLRHIHIDAPNIVYSAHIYPNRKPAHWWKAVGRWSHVPIFVAEWGGQGDDCEFGRKLARLMRQRSIGWSAWSWVDYPRLVLPPRAPAYQPTLFGELVRNELRT